MTDEKIIKLQQEFIKTLEDYAKASDKLTLQYIEARNELNRIYNSRLKALGKSIIA